MASPNEYIATSGQTTFTYDFQIFADSEIKVYKRATGTDPNDTTDLLTLTTDYTVTGAGDAGGGTIVLTTGATTGDIVTLVSNISVSRLIEYQTNGDMLAATVNTDFDRIYTLIAQELGVTNNRLVRFSDSEQRSSNTNLIPTPVEGKALGWSSGELSNLTLSSASTDTDIDVIVGTGDKRKPLVVNEAENGWEMGLKQGYTAGGTADAITITTDSSLSAYNSNEIYWIDIQSANTGACTLNVDSFGVKNIKLPSGSDPVAGQLAAGGVHGFWYDGTNFILVNPVELTAGSVDTTELATDSVTAAKLDLNNLLVPVLISTTNISAGTTQDFATAFSANPYDYYLIIINHATYSAANDGVDMKFSTDGSTFVTGGYATESSGGLNAMQLLDATASASSDDFYIEVRVCRPTDTNLYTTIESWGWTQQSGGPTAEFQRQSSVYEATTAVTGFQLLDVGAGASFDAQGTVKIYGCNGPF